MNFQELYKKIHAIDKGIVETEDKANDDYDGDGNVETEKEEVWGSRARAAAEKGKPFKEELTDECGMMGDMAPPQPKQMDNVNMNVSMNASGAGGIRDLLNVIKDIQDGPDDSAMSAEPVTVKHIDKMGALIDDDFANQPDETYSDMSAVMPTGGDLHSKGLEAPKMNGGGNPMAHMSRLESLYQQIKLREGSKDLAAKKDRKKKVNEGSEFGGSYAERLARKVFDLNPKLDTSGRADELLKTGYQTAVIDLGEKMDAKRSRRTASHMFGYDEDFPSDFVSAYNYLQKQNLNDVADNARIDTDHMMEGSGPKEKQHSKYVDRNSPKSKAKVQAAKDTAAKSKAAEPGKKLLSKIKSK